MRINLIAARTQRLVDSAALYQALGGGLSGDHAASAVFYPVKKPIKLPRRSAISGTMKKS